MENYQNTTRDQEGQNVENESWITNNLNPPIQKNPYDDSQEIENDRSNLFPEDESSLDTSPTYNEYEDDEDEEITDEYDEYDEDDEEDEDEDDDNDLDNDPLEEDGDFEEKDNDYREKNDKDLF